MKLEFIPPDPHGPKPPLLSIQLSTNDKAPTKKTNRCSQSLDLFFGATLLTPSSISMLRNSVVLDLPKRSVIPTVTKKIKNVANPLNVGTTLKSLFSKAMNPTASSTTGTEAMARTYPKNQPSKLTTESSRRIIEPRVDSVPPITL